jgi:TonB family protein
MSAGPARAVEEASRRAFLRHQIGVPLDLIALRSGVPENLPGRCTDISESGVGAVVAGELTSGQQVAVELRLPGVGVPVRARALVRYQSQLRCGLEFSGLSMEQREMIRYFVYRSASKPLETNKREENVVTARSDAPAIASSPAVRMKQRIRFGRRALYLLIACILMLSALAWWQWQRSWNELEKRPPVSESDLRVSPETMEKRIVTKIDPFYPEAARTARTEGLVVLDAIIAPDGSVKSLRTVSGTELLVKSASSAVQLWKFEPYLSSGKPVEETTIAVEFRLN